MSDDLDNSKQESSGWGGVREGAGKPGMVPTDEERAMVEKLSGFGLQQESIAAMVRDGIHVDTFF